MTVRIGPQTVTTARQQAGFTLLEVLVAVAVVALGLSALLLASTQATSASGSLRDKTLGGLVARNVIVEYQTQDSWPETGRADGEEALGGAQWGWEAEIVATSDDFIRRINVAVFAPGSTGTEPNPVIRLSAFLPSPDQAGAAVPPNAGPGAP